MSSEGASEKTSVLMFIDDISIADGNPSQQ